MECLSNYKDIEVVNCADGWPSNVRERLQCMLENEQLCDIFLVTSDGGRIGAHKNMLAASSAFFWSSFVDEVTDGDKNVATSSNSGTVNAASGSKAPAAGSNTKKKTKATPAAATSDAIEDTIKPIADNEIHLIDIDGKVLKMLVTCCYTGGLELSFETVAAVLKVAIDLEFHAVIEACSAFLLCHLNAESCCFVEVLANRYGLTSLADTATEYVLNNFGSVSRCDGFAQVPTDKLSVYLHSDHLVVSSEEDVFHALMHWTLHDAYRRLSLVPALLPLVRLTELKDTFLFDEVQNFAVGNNCAQLIIDALNWKLMPNRRDRINTKFETRPRNYNISLLAIGGIDNIGASNMKASSSQTASAATAATAAADGAAATSAGSSRMARVERYSYITNDWSEMQCNFELPVGCAIVELNGELIILGGCQHKNRSVSSVRCVKFGSAAVGMQITSMANMHIARAYHSAVALNGQIYVAGGRNGSSTLTAVECYDPTTGKWCQLASLSIGRFDFNLAAVKNHLYAIGGGGSDSNTTTSRDEAKSHRSNVSYCSVERYDPAVDKWTPMAAMNQRRSQAASAVCNDRIYVFGGFDNDLTVNTATDIVECYDVDKNKWTLVAPMTSARFGHCATAAIGGFVVVAGGGEMFKHRIHCVERYDVTNNVWSQLAPLKWPRSFFHLCRGQF